MNLSNAARPRNLGEYVGHATAVRQVETLFSSRTPPDALLISGGTGAGKTTLANIVAIAAQEPKSMKRFGHFKPERYDRYLSQYEIRVQAAAEYAGVEDMRRLVSTADLLPTAPSRRRVIILDEAHNLSASAQEALLLPLERKRSVALWILCTTTPHKLKPTLRRRCASVVLGALSREEIDELFKHIASRTGEQYKSVGKLVDYLAQGAYTPGQCVAALEHYVSTGVLSGGTTHEEIPSIEVCRALVRGAWPVVAQALVGASAEGARTLRIMVCGYLRTMLLSTDSNAAARAEKALDILLEIPPYEEPLVYTWVAVRLRKACRLFG